MPIITKTGYKYIAKTEKKNKARLAQSKRKSGFIEIDEIQKKDCTYF